MGVSTRVCYILKLYRNLCNALRTSVWKFIFKHSPYVHSVHFYITKTNCLSANSSLKVWNKKKINIPISIQFLRICIFRTLFIRLHLLFHFEVMGSQTSSITDMSDLNVCIRVTRKIVQLYNINRKAFERYLNSLSCVFNYSESF